MKETMRISDSMSQDFKSVSVQYHIVTTSDWTTFQILEGGFWSDVKWEFLKGKDACIGQNITYSDGRIKILKHPYDRERVEVMITCKLNIYKDYLTSNIRYMVEKGDIESTTVRVLHKEVEVYRMENRGNVRNNRNPKTFDVPVNKTPPTEPLKMFMTGLKIVGLFVIGYLGIFLSSLVYCLFFSLDFVEVAHSNPTIFIVSGAILAGTLIGIGSKRNWI